MTVETEKEARKEAVVTSMAVLVHQKSYQVLVAWTKTEEVLVEHQELQDPPREAAERSLVLLGLI